MKFFNDYTKASGYHFDITERISVRIGIVSKKGMDQIRYRSWRNNRYLRLGVCPHYEFKTSQSGKLYIIGIYNVGFNIRRWYEN